MKASQSYAALVLAVFVVFGTGIGHGFVMWDDPMFILLNPLVQGWSEASWMDRLATPQLGYPTPLPVAIHAALSAIFEDAAPAMHLLSVGFHGAAAVLLASLLRCWGLGVPGAAIGAAVWALHPAVVESVSWATNLKELLLVFGVLGALRCWEASVKGEADWRSRSGMVAFACVAFAAKPTALVLPVMMALRALAARRRPESTEVVVWGAIAAAAAGWFFAARSMHAGLLGDSAADFAGRDSVLAVLDPIGLHAMHYVTLRGFDPFYPLAVTEPTFLTAIGSIAVAGWLGATGLAWARGAHLASFAAAAAVVGWAPYSNLIPLPRLTADTYLYLCSAFGVSAVVLVLGPVLARLEVKPVLRWGFVAVVLGGLGLSSMAQVTRWQSTRALFEPLLGEPQRFAVPYALIAYEEFVNGRGEAAVELLDEAWPRLRETRELPRFAAQAYLQQGRAERASEARLRVVAVLDPGPASAASAFAWVVANDLAVPDDEVSRRVFAEGFGVWRAGGAGPTREEFEDWQRRHAR